MMRRARLRGGDHERIGEIATVAEGAAAVALSRGGASKTYSHRHPNEDAAGLALGCGGSLAVVADGHAGREAAELAVDHVLDVLAPRWLGAEARGLEARFSDEASDATRELNAVILRAGLGDPRTPSRTTLSVALARTGEDWLGYWSIGDSHIFEVDGEGTREACVADKRVVYLGDATISPAKLIGTIRCVTRAQGDTRCLVLATDGLSETGIGVTDPAATIAAVLAETRLHPRDLRPLEIARSVAARALEAQRLQRAGDNVATAVLWLDLSEAKG
jgi:serine/threonine protein phosphatase PrpC